MLIALHNLAAKHANLLTSIRIAREAGYAGVEIDGGKLRRYLAQGFGIETLLPLFKETPAVGLSYVQDMLTLFLDLFGAKAPNGEEPKS